MEVRSQPDQRIRCVAKADEKISWRAARACGCPYQGITLEPDVTTQGCPEGYGRKGVAVSSGVSLAFMVIGLLAVVFALVVVWRRSPNASRTPLPAPADQGQAERSQLEAVSAEAEQIRTRAETEAAGILERARQEAEQSAQGRREVDDEIRSVKDEVREQRGVLERRETRLADREQRLDAELERIEDRAN